MSLNPCTNVNELPDCFEFGPFKMAGDKACNYTAIGSRRDVRHVNRHSLICPSWINNRQRPTRAAWQALLLDRRDPSNAERRMVCNDATRWRALEDDALEIVAGRIWITQGVIAFEAELAVVGRIA